jgi:hypothetical protein
VYKLTKIEKDVKIPKESVCKTDVNPPNTNDKLLQRIMQLEKKEQESSYEVPSLGCKVDTPVESTSTLLVAPPAFQPLQQALTIPTPDKTVVSPAFLEPVEVEVITSPPDKTVQPLALVEPVEVEVITSLPDKTFEPLALVESVEVEVITSPEPVEMEVIIPPLEETFVPFALVEPVETEVIIPLPEQTFVPLACVEPVAVEVTESAPDPRKSAGLIYKPKRITAEPLSKSAQRCLKRQRNRRNKAIRRNANKRLEQSAERLGAPLVYIDEDVLELVSDDSMD